jgi:glyoxylase-like metal-dependent hydrolase (beta-lactamase superfamily II)
MNTPATPLPLVRSFHHAPTGLWTHVIVDPSTRHAAIVDAVLDFDLPSGRISTESAQRVLEYLATASLELKWVLETHVHADHLTAGGWIADRTGARLGTGAGIVDVQKSFKRLLDLDDTFDTNGSQFDRLFGDGERFRIGEIEAEVIATPGHTPDSVAYRVGDALFVGDTLFAPDTGTARCDFPGGDAAKLFRSIQTLHALPDHMRVFLCHDYPSGEAPPRAESDIASQKRSNIHLCTTTTEADYVALRTRRDATLAPPRLLWPAIQFNIRGGRLPPAKADGSAFFKLPVVFAET